MAHTRQTISESFAKGLAKVKSTGLRDTLCVAWARFWMLFAGLSFFGRLATRLATWTIPPYYGRHRLSWWSPRGFISPTAILHCRNFHLGANLCIDDHVVIFQGNEDGAIELGDRVHLWRDTIIQTGAGGSVVIGSDTHVQARCVFSAFKGHIQIGRRVQIAPNCAFYPYNHGMTSGEPISHQPLQTRGGIVVGDDSWLGFGVIVLDGVRIGEGAVVGAGAVVTREVPDRAIAIGVPARVVGFRDSSLLAAQEAPSESPQSQDH